MNLTTPDKIRNLQRKLYCKAKAEPTFRFYLLYDKICREDILLHAYRLARVNAGAPGVDGMTFAQIEKQGLEAWLAGLRAELVSKTYRPDPVRRVMIPKANGGERPLGIPTIRDRVIQTAAKIVIEPIFEADFEDNAYGYRPARGAVDAVKEVHRHLCRGYADVVDADLSKYFDRVNHDRLMAAVAARVTDRRLLRLIRSYLTAGVLDNGLFEDSREGTPQGGPLSPLLSNLVLDELDRELKSRGHRFVRYADDCNIYVRSEKAGRRVMESLTRFIERRLKLQINAEKSAVARPWHRTFLGFTVRNEPEFRRCIADKAIIRFKHRVRELTRRHRGITQERMIRELVSYLRGWAGYFGFSQWRELQSLDSWIRRRLRCVVWVQWKTRGRRYHELRRLGVPGPAASEAVFSPKGPWRMSFTNAMHRAFTNARFKRLGLLPMEKLVDA